MTDYEGKAVTSDVTSGNMVFEPILEEGVFRFDCSGNDRGAAFPSLSFSDSKVRDTTVMIHKVPMSTPTFECLHGQQIVSVKLPTGTSFYGTGEVSGQLERTGKRDLPTLYLQGGSIIPVGPPLQHVGEANRTDDLSLIVALDEHGKAEGVLFEDDGDGYEFNQGGYLLTYYVAELVSSTVTVKVSKTEGSWRRPKRRLHVQLLFGGGAMVDAWGTDGEVLQIIVPSESKVSNLISTSEKQYKTRMEIAKQIPDVEEVSGQKGMELSTTPVELKSGDWLLKVVPWIGGRMISMTHLPSGTQWLHSRVEVNGYEEYSGVEYRSAGCSEEYTVVESLEQTGEEESINLEGDVGGGLVLQRQISIPKDDPKVLKIDSGIIARKVGAGSGGYSRLVCLRVHPMFTLLHPTEVFVTFVSINGSKHELWPESGEQLFEGDRRPNGKWMLVDKCLGLGLVNRFNVSDVYKCLIHWGTGTVNMELWSEERPVSKDSPLKISHEYEVKTIS